MKVHRQRVSVVIVHENKVLGFHAEDPTSKQKYFFLPGGKIESGESKAEAAIRETREETGFQIEIPDQASIHQRYDFEWDGQTYDSETWFYRGELKSLKAIIVQDAAYHRGVDWIPVGQLDQYFSYHSEILSAVRALVTSN